MLCSLTSAACDQDNYSECIIDKKLYIIELFKKMCFRLCHQVNLV